MLIAHFSQDAMKLIVQRIRFKLCFLAERNKEGIRTVLYAQKLDPAYIDNSFFEISEHLTTLLSKISNLEKKSPLKQMRTGMEVAVAINHIKNTLNEKIVSRAKLDLGFPDMTEDLYNILFDSYDSTQSLQVAERFSPCKVFREKSSESNDETDHDYDLYKGIEEDKSPKPRAHYLKEYKFPNANQMAYNVDFSDLLQDPKYDQKFVKFFHIYYPKHIELLNEEDFESTLNVYYWRIRNEFHYYHTCYRNLKHPVDKGEKAIKKFILFSREIMKIDIKVCYKGREDQLDLAAYNLGENYDEDLEYGKYIREHTFDNIYHRR